MKLDRYVMYDFAFQSALEQLVNCILKATAGNIMNCPKKGIRFYENAV